MKAVVYEKYGSPEVLKFKEIEKPIPKDNEILVKIFATSVHRGDVIMRSLNLPYPAWQKILARLFLGIRKPRRKILGMEISGEVETIGKGVTKYKTGDQVFASTFSIGFGGYAEYKCIPQDGIVALKPQTISFEEAATLPGGATTALLILKKADIQKGQKVLIYGGSGSVGTFAVQIAKNLGADVTAVCSTSNIELVKSLGANSVIDYTKEDFANNKKMYDVVFDAVSKLPPNVSKKALKENGTYLNVISSSGNAKEDPKNLVEIKNLIETTNLRSVIDKVYPFDKIVEAHEYVDKGHKKGNVAITIVTENDRS